MAKESMKARELKRKKLIKKYAEKRAKYKKEGNYEATGTPLKLDLRVEKYK